MSEYSPVQRLDKLLVENGLAATRTQAQKLIEAALVEVKIAGQWQVYTKPSIKFAPGSELRTGDHPELRYVSRAGLKLEAVLRDRKIDVEGLVAIDIGQSTGGFTDCLLKHGAAQIVGIEVGHDQLAESLRNNPKVTCLEGYNARQLDRAVLDHIEGQFDIAVMDVSFISQKLILPNIAQLLKSQAWLITLIKPQFEVGPEGLGKGGIVRADVDMQALQNAFVTLLGELDFEVLHYQQSPIQGGDGNREFLLVARLLG